MDSRTRTFAVVGVALATASAATFTVYRAAYRVPPAAPVAKTRPLVVAARPLAIGTAIAAGDVKVIAWPADAPIGNAFQSPGDVAGRGVVISIAENQPITESALAPRDAGSGLSAAIPAGMRAIAVKVNEVVGVAGFVVPGTRVDVIASVRQSQDTAARVLVANVPVVTAGTRYDQEKARDGKPIPATVVTLIVTPAQAEQIALASVEGQVTLMLRNPLDQTEPDTPGAHLAALVAAKRAAPIAKRVTRAPAPPRRAPAIAAVAVAAAPQYLVEAIRAGKRTEEVVK